MITQEQREASHRLADIMDQCRHDLEAALREMATMALAPSQHEFMARHYGPLVQVLTDSKRTLLGPADDGDAR